MTAVTSTTSNGSSTSAATSTTSGTDAAGTEDRFLKLLVAQMKNQDPMNPLDNAQVTSQMAQINTVTGIDKLNTTVTGLNTQFVQMQALQGASLVGRDVTVAGDRLAIASGLGEAGFELAGPADSVKVDVLNGAGRVVDTVDLGAQTSGLHGFEWKATGVADGSEYHFRVTAKSGSTAVASTALMLDHVNAVNAGGNTLSLDLQYSGTTAYSKVKAFN